MPNQASKLWNIHWRVFLPFLIILSVSILLIVFLFTERYSGDLETLSETKADYEPWKDFDIP
jgi:hypothetical protein